MVSPALNRVRLPRWTYPVSVRKTAPSDGEGRILVVDDEPHILRALQATLRGAGYDVVTAATGEEALRECRGSPSERSSSRPGSAGSPRFGGLPRTSLLVACPHPRPLRGRRRGREGRRARRGRRRLRNEAVRYRRAARAAQSRSAQNGARNGPDHRDRRACRRPRQARRLVRGRARRADAE